MSHVLSSVMDFYTSIVVVLKKLSAYSDYSRVAVAVIVIVVIITIYQPPF